MTRENLIQAIYDNTDEWSCAYSCPHTMEEENPKDVCWKCAESLLSEYEQKIRAEVLKEVECAMYHQAFNIDHKTDGLQRWDGGNWIRYKLFENVIEQLKEQNK